MFPQSTLLDPIFWMVMGAIQLYLFQNARYWAGEFRLNMNPAKWVLVGGWWASFLLTIAGAFTLLGENEATPAGISLVLSALPGDRRLRYRAPACLAARPQDSLKI